MALTDYLKSIADAIRYAEGSTGKINAQMFAERIRALKKAMSELRPEVPQTGTWQLKETTGKKYIIIGTDDDNIGNAKFFRLLRTYNFPYTMNVEAEYVSIAKVLGSDIDDTIFTAEDAPSLFPNGVDIVTLGKYMHDNNLGEVAQHGLSTHTLWDSARLIGDFLSSVYSEYVNLGGTKTEEELRTAIIEQLAHTDVAQGALYTSESKAILEETYGFPICTVGIWGGEPVAVIDGISLSMKAISDVSNYNWRKDNYTAVGTRLVKTGDSRNGIINPYELYRASVGVSGAVGAIDSTNIGRSIELFWHMPFNDDPDITKWRELFDYIKSLEDSGTVEVVTRKQYAELGEYVENPITNISVKRENIPLGEIDSDSAYTVIATYTDGSTANVSDEAIVYRSLINTEVCGTYTVSATYRGFNADSKISVIDASYTVPVGLKDKDYWFIFKNETTGVYYAGNTTGTFGIAKASAKILTFTNCSNGKMNGWKSTDGRTWEQTDTDEAHYQAIKTTSGEKVFDFNMSANDVVTWLETSGNFTLDY